MLFKPANGFWLQCHNKGSIRSKTMSVAPKNRPFEPEVITSHSDPRPTPRLLPSHTPGRTSSACSLWGCDSGPSSGSHCPSHHSRIWGQCRQRWSLPREKGVTRALHSGVPGCPHSPLVVSYAFCRRKFPSQHQMNNSNLAKACGFQSHE